MPGVMVDPIKAAQAMELGDMGYSQIVVAERTGLNPSTVSDIVGRYGRWGEVANRPVFLELRAQQKAILHAGTLALSARALVQVEKTIDKASAYQAAGIYGLLRTHDRLDAGESTQNVSIHSTLDLVSLDKLSEMLGQALMSTDVIEPEK
jgi:hypothetical protein